MRTKLTRWLLASSIASATLLGVPTIAAAQPVERDHRRVPPGPREAPPPPKLERVEPRAGFVWIRGRWDWRAGNWDWVPGHWERAHANVRR